MIPVRTRLRYRAAHVQHTAPDTGAGTPPRTRPVGGTAKRAMDLAIAIPATVALARDGSNFGYIVSFVLPDGREIDLWHQYEAERG